MMQYQKSFAVSDYRVPTSNVFFNLAYADFRSEDRNITETLKVPKDDDYGFEEPVFAKWWLYVCLGQFYLKHQKVNYKALFELMCPCKRYTRLDADQKQGFIKFVRKAVRFWNDSEIEYRHYSMVFDRMAKITEDAEGLTVHNMAFYDALELHRPNERMLTRLPFNLVKFASKGRFCPVYSWNDWLYKALSAIKVKVFLLMRFRAGNNRGNKKMKQVILMNTFHRATYTTVNTDWLKSFLAYCEKDGIISNIRMNDCKMIWE